ncbi:class I SAM-dependent methyltransferase, partial [Candidatus Bathyarchaeota archaeon]
MTLQTHRIGDITRGINAPNLVCRICGNTKGNTVYHVRDMMFGYRDEFAYFQCSSCECLQINAFPSDMTRYYLSQYYSFVLINQREQPKEIMSQVSSYAQSYKNSYAAFGRGVVGRILYALSPNPTARERLRTLLRESFPPGDLENLGITPNSSLLDVGCGSGSRLLGLYGAGFRTLGGIDLYIESDTHYENGVQVLKRTIHEISGSWDVIMFHHSFEHLSDQVETIRSVARLLSKNGLCIIRIPTVTSYAWENYKEHWVQLDAPRHFYLHSIKSMQLLATRL